MHLDKGHALAALRARMTAQLETLTSSHRAAQAGATHAEAKQEHPKDTRAIEGQYLARGLAARVETLRDDVARIAALPATPLGDDDPISVPALVGVASEEGDESIYLLVPAGGGESLDVEGTTVLAVTPASPVGGALVGRRIDDDVPVDLPGGRGQLVVTWVR